MENQMHSRGQTMMVRRDIAGEHVGRANLPLIHSAVHTVQDIM